MLNLLNRFQDGLDATRRLDFLAPLLLRLYLGRWQNLANLLLMHPKFPR